MQNVKKNYSNILTTGLAIFSMFFGAGNVVFALAIGQWAQSHNIFAIIGLLITGVGVPLLGLISMTLFNGNYTHFFERIGKIPGFLVTVIILGLIGPFGAIPRCIALSYSTVNFYFSDTHFALFSFISCIVIYLFTFKKNSILDVLGYVLTPFLLFCLGLIIFKGILGSSEASIVDHQSMHVFFHGLKAGYQTMDLIGAFFFSSVVLSCLEKDVDPSDSKTYGSLIYLTLKAGAIASILLGAIYVGFSYIAAYNSALLEGVSHDELIGIVAQHVLGSCGGIVASLAVVLASLTTAIALSSVFAEFLHNDITRGKLGYQPSLIITLALSFAISTLKFEGIACVLLPILQIAYPALITLSVLNMAHKLIHFQPVKLPVLIVFLISIYAYFM
jgi:branched-chain amino acid:cation transporter, LIVCS family